MKQSINKPKYIKMNVHRCRANFIFVVPRQEITIEETEIFLISLKDTGSWEETRWSVDDAKKVDVKYCPYCGQLLIEEDTTD